MHTSIASSTGTFVYNDTISKLIISSFSSSSIVASLSAIFFVEVLIWHCGTTFNHSVTCSAMGWYTEPGIDKTGLNGTTTLWTFAKPYSLAG